MKNLFAVLIVLILAGACTDDGSIKNSPPPPEVVGAWLQSISQQNSSSNNSQDVCDQLDVSQNFVSTQLFKIDEFGNVYDGKEIVDAAQPYRDIGTMDSNGNISPNAIGRKEFLGGFSEISGATLNPIVSAKYNNDLFKGERLEIKVDLQIIVQGQSSTQEWEKREYFKATEATEKAWITKAQKCLTKTKPSK